MRRLYPGAAWQSRLSHGPLVSIAAVAAVFLSACVWNAEALGASFEHSCPAPSTNHATCYALLDKTEEGVKTYTAGSGELGGFDPSELRSAYKLPSTGGSGQTVAIVDADNDPNAESDLAAYRAHYELSECTKASGCFKKVNQKGEEGSYPENSRSWSEEISVDLDMVSAACPGCHILLVEANSNAIGELAASVIEAIKLGATVIDNGYGLPEEEETGGKGYASYDSDYDHPGIPTTVAAGDAGYDNHEESAKTPSFPATAPDVISVGGTTLLPSEGGRGWAETVWTESGGGCSLTQTKPSWQTFYTGCKDRMDNDVAAVADTSTPVSVYDTYEMKEKWHDFGGTSVSAALMAGAEALSTSFSRSREGAEAFYLAASAMFDITKGTNYPTEGGCTPASLCNAEVGYDGPSGNGTLDGALALLGAEWRQGGAELLESVGTKSKGSVKLTDEGDSLEVECEGAGEGSVGAGSVGEESKWAKSKCTLVKAASCEAGKGAELSAVSLSWHSELVMPEGAVRDSITTGGKGTPGFTIKCTVGGILKVVDECTGTLKTSVTNAAGGVDAAFDGEKLKCSVGGAGAGALEGTELIEAAKGGTLEVTGPAWRQGGAELLESAGTKSKGSVKLTDEGDSLEVECEGTGEGSVGAGSVGEESKWAKSKCTLVKAASCEAGKGAELSAVHLSWHSELVMPEGGAVREVITTSGKGTPGFSITCTVGGILKVVDECTGTLKTSVTNAAGGVDAEFDGEKLKCSVGGAGAGALEGTELIEAAKGGTLEVVT